MPYDPDELSLILGSIPLVNECGQLNMNPFLHSTTTLLINKQI